MVIDTQTLLFALLGGVLPALLWLWFWLKEDSARPEPRGLLLLAFIAGMVSVPLVIPIEQVIASLTVFSMNFTIIMWAATEEIMKYVLALATVLRKKAVDEPLDPIIYMITVALGFAALENTLFLLNPNLGFYDSIITGNLRFIGATLLHTLASASIGLMMALSFYKSPGIKRLYVQIGIVLSIILHSLFNFFIISNNGEKLLLVFGAVWFGIILLLLFFEKVKRITKAANRN